MRPFLYERPDSMASALQMGIATDRGPVDAQTQYLAGGTTLIDLMKLDVLHPRRVVDLAAARPEAGVEIVGDRIRLGAFTTMAAVADHPQVKLRLPALTQSLDLAASPQLRNMATLGGNVLQKTRCPYYRDPTWSACNKRDPGTGCTALTSPNRNHAVLGVDSSCISQYPGDFAIALMALDAQVSILGHGGRRSIPFDSLHRSAEGLPHLETSLAPGDIITAFDVPAAPWLARSLYLKVRDRASYEFALVSVAVALDLEGDTVREVRIALGGMAYRPWRAKPAETSLTGKSLTVAAAEEAARIALEGAVTHQDNQYKPQMARAAIVRALMQVKALPVQKQST